MVLKGRSVGKEEARVVDSRARANVLTLER